MHTAAACCSSGESALPGLPQRGRGGSGPRGVSEGVGLGWGGSVGRPRWGKRGLPCQWHAYQLPALHCTLLPPHDVVHPHSHANLAPPRARRTAAIVVRAERHAASSAAVAAVIALAPMMPSGLDLGGVCVVLQPLLQLPRLAVPRFEGGAPRSGRCQGGACGRGVYRPLAWALRSSPTNAASMPCGVRLNMQALCADPMQASAPRPGTG